MQPINVGTMANVARYILGMPQQENELVKREDEVFLDFLEPQWKLLSWFVIWLLPTLIRQVLIWKNLYGPMCSSWYIQQHRFIVKLLDGLTPRHFESGVGILFKISLLWRRNLSRLTIDSLDMMASPISSFRLMVFVYWLWNLGHLIRSGSRRNSMVLDWNMSVAYASIPVVLYGSIYNKIWFIPPVSQFVPSVSQFIPSVLRKFCTNFAESPHASRDRE